MDFARRLDDRCPVSLKDVQRVAKTHSVVAWGAGSDRSFVTASFKQEVVADYEPEWITYGRIVGVKTPTIPSVLLYHLADLVVVLNLYAFPLSQFNVPPVDCVSSPDPRDGARARHQGASEEAAVGPAC